MEFPGNIYEQFIAEYENSIPGIEKIMLFFRGKSAEVICYLKEHESNIMKNHDCGGSSDFIEEKMRETFTYKWLRKHELPFERTNKKQIKKQLEIDDEIIMPVLLIKIESETPGLCDLIFLFLKENSSGNAAMTADPSPYSKQTKEYMGFILYLMINRIIEGKRKDFAEFRRIAEKYGRISKMSGEIDKTSKDFFKSVCDDVVQGLSEKTGYQAVLDESLYQYLSDNCKSITQLKNIIEEVFMFKVKISPGKEFRISRMEIEEDYITYPAADNIEPAETDELKKAYNLLESYEEIASRLNKEVPVSVKFIANSLKRTLAAVTVSINSRKAVIKKLLDINPDKWFRIRNELPPVRRIDNEIKGSRDKMLGVV